MKNFKAALEARRKAAQSQSVEKDPSQMTPEELDAAIQRTEEEIRAAKEGQLRAGREVLLTERGRPMFLGGRRRRRPYWK